MQKVVFLLIFILLISFNTYSQNYYFNKTFATGELYSGAASIVELDDGYMVLGRMLTSIDSKLILQKINFNGDSIWQKKFGNPPEIYFASDIFKLADGNLIITGSVKDTAGGMADFFLAKFDLNGDTLWTKKYGIDTAMDGLNYSITTNDSGYLLVGQTTGPGGADYYVIKTDSLGNLEWDKTYGGVGYEIAFSAIQTDDNDFIFGGYSNSFNNNYDAYLVKTNSSGNIIWQKTYGDNNKDDSGASISKLYDGNYIITSGIRTNSSTKKAYLAKIDSSGTIIWDKYYQPRNYSTFAGNTPLENFDSTILIGGYVKNDLGNPVGWLLKINSAGNTIWSKEYFVRVDKSNYIYDIKPASNSGYIFCGEAWNNTKDLWVVKTDSNGCFGPPKADFTFTITDSTTVIFNNQSQNLFDYLWFFGDGDSSISANPTHTYQDKGNYIVTLIAQKCGKIDTITDTVSLGITGLEAINDQKVFDLKVYPNPSMGTITIVVSQKLRNLFNSKLIIYDITGRKVKIYTLDPKQNSLTIRTKEIGTGEFVVQLVADGVIVAREKIVIVK